MNYFLKRNNIFKNSFFKYSSRKIHYNSNNGYYTPENQNHEIQEVKDWLNVQKPELLCIYFTNTWNPVCKRAQPQYANFARKNGAYKHLLVDTDKFPRLRWYFDAKMDPYLRAYYYGASIVNLGGANFEKFTNELNAAKDYIHNDMNPINESSTTWEQPYYRWENELHEVGVTMGADSTQSVHNSGFRPPHQLQFIPNEPRLVHVGIKK